MLKKIVLRYEPENRPEVESPKKLNAIYQVIEPKVENG